jgi:hypothetical protein
MTKAIQEQKKIKITVRFTEAEREFVASETDACGISMSSFIRQRTLGKRITPKTDLRVLAELRRLGGLLKHLHNETKGAYSALTANCLKEISAYLRCMNSASGDSRKEEKEEQQ